MSKTLTKNMFKTLTQEICLQNFDLKYVARTLTQEICIQNFDSRNMSQKL